MPQGVGYGPQAGPPQQGGLAEKMPNAAAVAEQFKNQQKPFGWLTDMIQHITGALQPSAGQAPQAGQPATQQGQQPQQQGQPQGQKQSQEMGQPQGQPGQPGQVPGGMIDPSGVQQLMSLFQPNALSNLGLLPQQQGNWNWVLSLMQQGQAAKAQAQRGQGGDLVSLVNQLGNKAGGSMVPEAGGAPKSASSGAKKG